MATEPAQQLQAILAANVKARRGELGWTQGELSERSGVARSDVSRIEGARLNVTILTIARLALALRVEAADLLGR